MERENICLKAWPYLKFVLMLNNDKKVQRSFSVNCYAKIYTKVIVCTDAFNIFFEWQQKGSAIT